MVQGTAVAKGRRRPNAERPPAAHTPVDPAEAAQLACCFALDYLSWDEEQPSRRAEVLRRYLPENSDTTVGWSGVGRQRADFACPGRIVPESHRLWVDVRVRVTPYQRVPLTADSSGLDLPEPSLPEGAIWSAAPAPTTPAWTAGPSVWMRLTTPIRRHHTGGVVVDLSTIPDPDRAEGPE